MVDMTDMQKKLLRMLKDVGYTGPMFVPNKLTESLQFGPKSPDFTSLIAWFAEQLATFIDIDETVHATTSPDDASSFLLELSFFLKEIGCVNEKLMSGNVNQRLANELERAILIEFLAAELMACKMLEVKCPKEEKQLEVTINESDTAGHLKNLLKALKIDKLPDNISSESMVSIVERKLTEIYKTVPPTGTPIINLEMSNIKWEQIHKLQKELHQEYTIRRAMLLKRLDVTISSFLWNEKLSAKQVNEIEQIFQEMKKLLKINPKVTIADLLAARDNLAEIEKISNAIVRKYTRSKVNSVIIGAVPDRGGRPYEQEPPPPEMPPWQKDRVGGPPFQGGRGGARGGGGGGDRGRAGGGYGRGGGGGGGGGGYRDHKDASSNFGQNLDYRQQSQYSGHGHRECYPDHKNAGGYQGGGGGGNYRDSNASYNQNYGQGSGRNYNQGSSQSYGQGQSYGQNYQQPQYFGQRDSYGGDNRGGGNYYQDRREGRGGGGGGGGSRSGRVQGGWNQGGNNSGANSYQQGGYKRGGGRKY